MTPPEIKDLGWYNNDQSRKEIAAAIDLCRALEHETTDVDISINRGYEHVVTCNLCGYVYRYDSSD